MCCGCAQLTFELGEVGFDAIGVDYAGNKDRPMAKFVNIDLVCDSGLKAAKGLVVENKSEYVHIAPSCGTASRARAIPISKDRAKQFGVKVSRVKPGSA